MNAYVYAILVDGICRYIGKGSGTRARAHMRIVRSIARKRAAGEAVRASHFYNRLTKAWLAGSEIEEVILVDGLTHEQAYECEIEEIASRTGLWNFWAGGEGGSKGYTKPPEQREKMAASNKTTWADPGIRNEQSERMKVHWLRPEYRDVTHAALKAAWQDPERCRKRSEAAKARWADPVFKEKMRLALSKPEVRAAQKVGWQKRRDLKHKEGGGVI